MPDFTICPAKEGDAPQWLALAASLSGSFPGLEMTDYSHTLMKNIRRQTALCAKTADDRLIGILLFSPARHTLSCMAVHPDWRRRGIASALIREMLRRMPPGDITVTTFREGDPKGEAPRALYHSFGFLPDALCTEFGYPLQRFLLPPSARAL